MTATLMLATVPHLREIAALLRQAAEESNSAFHERKLRRLVTGFEGLVQPFECIAAGLDAAGVTVMPPSLLSKEDDPKEADQVCNDSAGVEEGVGQSNSE
jgi:hypothetical protein